MADEWKNVILKFQSWLALFCIIVSHAVLCLKLPTVLHPAAVASYWLIFCIRLLLLNINEGSCYRAVELWPSKYIWRTQIWVSCDRSVSVCHLSIPQTLHKHIIWESSPQNLSQFLLMSLWSCISISDGSCYRKCFSDILDVFWPAYLLLISGSSQMNCYVQKCPGFF